MSRLTFTEQGHAYTLDGRKVPSVTTVVRNCMDKPALPYAASREAARWAWINRDAGQTLGESVWVKAATEAYREKWNRSRDDGSMLHKLAEPMVRGEPMPLLVNDEPVPDHIRDMAGQLARFMDTWQVEPLSVEGGCFNDQHRYAGRWDLVARLAGEFVAVLDYKTTASGVYKETALQLAAYRYSTHYVGDDGTDRPTSELDIARGGVVWIRPDKWELRPVQCDRHMFDYFVHGLAVSEFVGLSDRNIVKPNAARAVAS
jgi:uncharacterized protein (DUF1501 family)